MAVMFPVKPSWLPAEEHKLWDAFKSDLDDSHMVWFHRQVAGHFLWIVVGHPQRGAVILLPVSGANTAGAKTAAFRTVVPEAHVATLVVDPTTIGDIAFIVNRSLPKFSAPGWLAAATRALQLDNDGWDVPQTAQTTGGATLIGPAHIRYQRSPPAPMVAGVTFLGAAAEVHTEMQKHGITSERMAQDDLKENDDSDLVKFVTKPVPRRIKLLRTRAVNTDPAVLRCRRQIQGLLTEAYQHPDAALRRIESMAVKAEDEIGPERAATIAGYNPERFGELRQPLQVPDEAQLRTALQQLREALAIARERAERSYR